MNPDDIVGIVERIAELLTPGAQRAWEIAVRQVGVETMLHWRYMWGWIAGAVVGIAMFVGGYRWQSKDDMGLGCHTTLIGLALTIAGIGMAIQDATTAQAMGMNPDYYAIRILLGLVGR